MGDALRKEVSSAGIRAQGTLSACDPSRYSGRQCHCLLLTYQPLPYLLLSQNIALSGHDQVHSSSGELLSRAAIGCIPKLHPEPSRQDEALEMVRPIR